MIFCVFLKKSEWDFDIFHILCILKKNEPRMVPGWSPDGPQMTPGFAGFGSIPGGAQICHRIV